MVLRSDSIESFRHNFPALTILLTAGHRQMFLLRAAIVCGLHGFNAFQVRFSLMNGELQLNNAVQAKMSEHQVVYTTTPFTS